MLLGFLINVSMKVTLLKDQNLLSSSEDWVQKKNPNWDSPKYTFGHVRATTLLATRESTLGSPSGNAVHEFPTQMTCFLWLLSSVV